MGTTLTGLKIKDTYQGLIKTTDNLPFASGILRRLSDGFGNETDLQLGTDKTVSSNMEVTDNLDFGATIAEIEAGDDSIVITKGYFISKESVILDDLISLNESVQEIIETPSGLVLFDLKGSELWLSVDGMMPTKVDLSSIATELKTIKLTITPPQMRAASVSIDDGSGFSPNPNIVPIVIVPDPLNNSAILATSIQARTIIGTGIGYDGITGYFVKSSIPSPLDLSYYPQCFLKTVLDGANGDSQVGDTILESAKGFDEESFGYTQLEEGVGLVLVFDKFYDQYVDGDIDLSVTYKEVTF